MLVSYISLGELRYRLSLIFFSKEILVFCELRILLSCFQRTFDWCIRISKMNRIGLQSLVFNLLYCVALWYPSIIVVYSYDYQIHILLCENSLNNYHPNIFFFSYGHTNPGNKKFSLFELPYQFRQKFREKKQDVLFQQIFNYIPLYDGVPDTWIMKISRQAILLMLPVLMSDKDRRLT